MKDLYGVGPALKAVGMLFLALSIVTKNFNYAFFFFLFYGIGSYAFMTHLYALKENTNNTIPVDAGIYEQIFNMILCFVVICYFGFMWWKNHQSGIPISSILQVRVPMPMPMRG